MTNEQVRDLQELLGHITGVEQALVVADRWGGIAEIHVIATTDRTPKQIVRDIETTLLIKRQIRVDYRIISVAVLEPAKG